MTAEQVAIGPATIAEPGSLGRLMLGAAVVAHWRRAHFRRAAKA